MRLIFFALLFSFESHAWICKEASSTRVGNTILSCGVSNHIILEMAKDGARDSAIREFKSICENSDYCKNHKIEVIPKRTDCDYKDSSYTCYRAIEFIITDKKKKDIIVDVKETHTQLQSKMQELEVLRKHLYELQKLKRTEHEIRIAEKQIEVIESEGIILGESISSVREGRYKYTHLLYQNSIKLSVGYDNIALTTDEEINLKTKMSYEYRPIRYIGFEFGLGFGGDFSLNTDPNIPNKSISNTKQSFRGPQSFYEVSIATNMYTGYKGVYIKLEAGQMNISRKMENVSYGPLGTRTKTDTIDIKESKRFHGLSLGLDSREDRKGFGGFIEAGVRQFQNESSLNLTTTIGVNYGF